ncbi:MAG: hypothetical protein ACOYL5_20670 [Phototrophicaceae bacterium]|jgi:hypothetical protein
MPPKKLSGRGAGLGSGSGVNSLTATTDLREQLARELQPAIDDGLLVQADDGWRFGRVKIGRVGMTVPDDLSEQEYSALGSFLLDVSTRIQWLLGDWLAYGENRQWGETYQQMADQFGYNVQSLRDYAYVCRNVDLSIRIDKLTFGHHQVVAPLNPEAQRVWLQAAEDNRWSIAALRKAIQQSNSLNVGESHQRRLAVIVPRWRKSWESMDANEKRATMEDLRQVLSEMESELGEG